MSLKSVPPRVRAHLYLYWVGLVVAGLGVVGFFLSFWQVGSPAQAAIDVHDQIPVFAYMSIVAWVAGLAVMWYSRRRVDAAVAAKLAADRDAALVDLSLLDPGSAPVPLGDPAEEPTTVTP